MKFATLMFATFLLVALVACSSDKDGDNASGGNSDSDGDSGGELYDNGLPKDKKVTLKYAHKAAGYGTEWIQYAMDSFHKKFPNVSFEPTFDPQPQKIVGTKIGAGDDEDMFDMFDSIEGPVAQSAVKAGKLQEVNDLWDHELYDAPGKTVKDAVLDAVYKGRPLILGDNYRMSVVLNIGGLYFDKKLFEEHGWNQHPDTWDEFLDLLETIKADGVVPLTYPGQYPTYLERSFGVEKELALAAEKGNEDEYRKNFRDYETPFYTTPEKEEVWNRVYQLGKDGYFDKGIPAIDHIASQMQVMQHKSAMVSTGSWVGGEMSDSTPEGFEWGYMAVPMRSSTDVPVQARTTPDYGFHIWKAKPELHVKWAKEFAVWLYNMDVQEKLAEGGAAPVRKDYGDDEERENKLDPSVKAAYNYINSDDVTVGQTAHTKTLDSPLISQASQNYKDNLASIAVAKKKPIPVLEKSEELFEKGLKEEK